MPGAGCSVFFFGVVAFFFFGVSTGASGGAAVGGGGGNLADAPTIVAATARAVSPVHKADVLIMTRPLYKRSTWVDLELSTRLYVKSHLASNPIIGTLGHLPFFATTCLRHLSWTVGRALFIGQIRFLPGHILGSRSSNRTGEEDIVRTPSGLLARP